MTTVQTAQQALMMRDLARLGLDFRHDPGTRAMYSTDASLYRIEPLAVVRPREAAEVAAVLDLARNHAVPITARGAGTSVAGNAVGRGVVLDFSRHLNRVLEVDPWTRTALVQPGTIHASLQAEAARHGLRFGPDPSTHTRCTVGGMIGNNACGSRSLAYGRTSDNVAGLRMLTAAGDTIVTGYDARGAATVEAPETLLIGLRRTIDADLAVARTEFARFGRQVSGYAVEHLLPERFDLGKALIGSEGTLGILTEARVRLVPVEAHTVVVVLGFDDIVAAGTAAPAVVAHGPTACEGLDTRLLDVLRRRRVKSSIPALPDGAAWLFVEFSGEDHAEVLNRAQALARADIGASAQVVVDTDVQAHLWRIREDGAGLAGRSPADRPSWPGWEDAAVPPDRLGAYLSAFDELVGSYGMTSAPFGHFGEGCMHVRLDVPLDRPDGLKVMRSFLVDAAQLVGSFGGSLSGEHGDGRARSQLLPHMYSPAALSLFAAVKAQFDPTNLLNPGVLVDPDPVDADVRVAGTFPLGRSPSGRRHLGFAYTADGGDLTQAVHRCTGVGKCRADNSAAGGVMCPSYLATREEKDSTRGRARVLQEVIRGDRGNGLTWRSPEVHDALDLCLSCKGCASDCPTGIDMATYKSEVLHQSYRRRLRPRSHYSLGWLPRWMRLASRMPGLANRALELPVLRDVALRAAKVDPRRSLPVFAPKTFRRRWRSRLAAPCPGTPVLVFVDSFTDGYAPAAAESTMRVLEAAGFSPRITGNGQCCGLTWITTGQLDAARRILRRTIAELAVTARQGIPIVGIEPSCTAVLRHDAVELLATQEARDVAAATHTLAELLLATEQWHPPDLAGTTVVAQPHCHHHAIMGWEADRRLLAGTGAAVTALSGCCGLAGNFGVELGHYDVSVKVAEQQLLPALDTHPDAIVLADGFSCRTQVADLRDRPSHHLAELLDPGTPTPR